MRTALPIVLLATLAGPIACGPAPTPVAPAPSGGVTPAPAQIAGPAALDLSPVAEPAAIVGVMRWKSPSATVAKFSQCAGLPPALSEGGARTLVAAVLDELVGRSVDDGQLATVIALDAPVHALVALDAASRRAKPIAAVSVGVTSLERAKGAVEASTPLTEVMPGLWKIAAKRRSAAACFLAASAGSTPARLICGDRDRDVVALGPYLARTMPTLAPEARDLHAELRLTTITNKFGQLGKQQLRGLPILAQSQMSIGEPRFDAALDHAALAVQDELSALIDDADKVTLDLDVDPASCVTLSGGIALRGTRSWLAATLADGASRAGPPPPIFWRLPKDSDSAFFGRNADPARYDDIFKTLRSLLEGYLAKENVGRPADRKALADLIAVRFGKDTSVVTAHGHVAPQPAAAKGAKPDARALFERALEGWIGWYLIGADEGPATTIKYFKDLIAVYNRPALTAALRKELGRDDAKLLPTVKAVPAPRELGKGAFAAEIKFNDIPLPDGGFDMLGGGPKKAKTLTLSVHLLVMGENSATWIAVGNDKAELVRRLTAVKGATGAGTLSARAGLDALKHGQLTSGGYMTIAPITRAFESGLSVAAGLAPGPMPAEVQQIAGLLSNLPHKGNGPMLFTTKVQGGTPSAEVSFQVTKPALEDIIALVMAGAKLAGAFGL